MKYNYKFEKDFLFTEESQGQFLIFRDKIHAMLKHSGAFTMDRGMKIGFGGTSHSMMACVDRLVELGEIIEVSTPGCPGQDRVFVEKNFGR